MFREMRHKDINIKISIVKALRPSYVSKAFDIYFQTF